MVFPYLKKMYLFLCHQRVSFGVCVCARSTTAATGWGRHCSSHPSQLDGVTHGNGAMMTARKANKLVAH